MEERLSVKTLRQILADELGINSGTDLLVFASHFNAVGPVEGGAGTFLDVLLETAETVIMPAFTYQTMIIPEIGPPDNAIVYGSGADLNPRAEIFHHKLPVHPDCGILAETMRRKKGTLRSNHPILSFVGQGNKAKTILAAQTLQDPLRPIATLETLRGHVLLIGVDHRQNFALHLAEQRTGRKTFTRWALTPATILELPGIPGCMEGFNALWGRVLGLAEVSRIGMARAEIYPLRPLLAEAERALAADPNFMLCDKPSCLSCRTRER